MKALKQSDTVPASEFSNSFVQGMYDRMAVSYFKYGKVANAYPEKLDALGTMQICLDAYQKDGNTEHLIDAANYCMIEFLRPRRPGAFFKPTDSSVGRKRTTGVIVGKHNDDLK